MGTTYELQIQRKGDADLEFKVDGTLIYTYDPGDIFVADANEPLLTVGHFAGLSAGESADLSSTFDSAQASK